MVVHLLDLSIIDGNSSIWNLQWFLCIYLMVLVSVVPGQPVAAVGLRGRRRCDVAALGSRLVSELCAPRQCLTTNMWGMRLLALINKYILYIRKRGGVWFASLSLKTQPPTRMPSLTAPTHFSPPFRVHLISLGRRWLDAAAPTWPRTCSQICQRLPG